MLQAHEANGVWRFVPRNTVIISALSVKLASKPQLKVDMMDYFVSRDTSLRWHSAAGKRAQRLQIMCLVLWRDLKA